MGIGRWFEPVETVRLFISLLPDDMGFGRILPKNNTTKIETVASRLMA